MKHILVTSLTAIIGQLPSILTYLLGMILAGVFRRRARTASLLVLLGAGLLLVITFIHPFAMQCILQTHTDWGWSHERLGLTISVLGFGINIVHAAGIALLIAAAFMGRSRHL